MPLFFKESNSLTVKLILLLTSIFGRFVEMKLKLLAIGLVIGLALLAAGVTLLVMQG